MKTEIAGGLLAKILVGVVTAATLGGGAAIIRAAETNAVQDVRLDRIEHTTERITELNNTLSDTKTEVALLRKELEKQADGK